MNSAGPSCFCPRFRGQLRVLPLATVHPNDQRRDPDDGKNGPTGTRRRLSEVQRAVAESRFLFNSVRISG